MALKRPKRIYKLCQPDIFRTIKTLLIILATLPVSSATAERSFSTQRQVKSDLRTIMGQARQDGLCVKLGLHEPQLPVARSVTLVSFIVVERRRCALQVSSVARLQENKAWFTRTTTAS